MQTKIIEREEIKLSGSQAAMIRSGWGENVLNETVVEKITYLSDGLKVHGYVAYPASHEGRLPCIMWNRGGFGDKGAIDRFNAKGIFGQIASWGYVVFASQYRGNAGGEGKEQLGGGDVNDILNLMELVREFPFADGDNWGMEGWSRGGMMTFLALRRTKKVRCAVLSGAISNLKQLADDNPDMKKRYNGLIDAENIDEELKKRSAVYFADELPRISYLLLHGGKDETVSPLQSINLAEIFHEKGINYRLVILEDGDHFLKSYREETGRLRKEWFEKYLKKA